MISREHPRSPSTFWSDGRGWEREHQAFASDEQEARAEAVRLALKTYGLERDEITILATTQMPAIKRACWLVRVRLA